MKTSIIAKSRDADIILKPRDDGAAILTRAKSIIAISQCPARPSEPSNRGAVSSRRLRANRCRHYAEAYAAASPRPIKRASCPASVSLAGAAGEIASAASALSARLVLRDDSSLITAWLIVAGIRNLSIVEIAISSLGRSRTRGSLHIRRYSGSHRRPIFSWQMLASPQASARASSGGA